MLTAKEGNDEIALSGKRFDYRRRVEESYVTRVEAILMPYVGPDGVRAEVSADIDFTTTEQTRETFNPDLPAVRSERMLEEERSGAGIAGVPGALTNEPPTDAAAPEDALAEAGAELTEEAQKQAPGSSRKQTTRNYELDRTISHTKPSTGTLRRLSIAVVIRDKAKPAPISDASNEESPNADGQENVAAAADGYTEQDLAEMTELVKDAIGFDIARGDTVSLKAAQFLAPPVAEPLPEQNRFGSRHGYWILASRR